MDFFIVQMDNAKFLDDFGFHFDDNGVLRTIDGGQKFKFEEKLRDQRFNQLRQMRCLIIIGWIYTYFIFFRYEALGEAVTREIYNLLESECDLKVSTNGCRLMKNV